MSKTERSATLVPAVVAQVERLVRPRAWWVAKAGSPEDGCAWTNQPTELDLATMRATTGCEVEVTELGNVAAERERIKAAVTRCTLFAENCEGDAPEVDTARKALACTILAAIAGYEAPPPVGTPGSLFGAQRIG